MGSEADAYLIPQDEGVSPVMWYPPGTGRISVHHSQPASHWPCLGRKSVEPRALGPHRTFNMVMFTSPAMSLLVRGMLRDRALVRALPEWIREQGAGNC